MFQGRPSYPAVCIVLGKGLLLSCELRKVFGVCMWLSVSLTLVELQFGGVDDEVLGLVWFPLGGQGANLRHLGVDPTNKHIRS